jgi:hypothetical protein
MSESEATDDEGTINGNNHKSATNSRRFEEAKGYSTRDCRRKLMWKQKKRQWRSKHKIRSRNRRSKRDKKKTSGIHEEDYTELEIAQPDND